AVVAVVDVLVGARLPTQPHDLVHRVDALGAGVDAVEAVRAVVDAVLVLGEVLEALSVLGVARIADEAVSLGQGSGADEQWIDLHRQAIRDAGAALDARHRLGDINHVLVRHDVLALGHRLLVDQPGRDSLDLLPVDRVHVDDQVADHGDVAHRLDGYDLGLFVGRIPTLTVAAFGRFAKVRVTRESGLAVHPHAARPADRLLTRAPDPDRAVRVVLDLQDRVEHGLGLGHVNGVLVPVGAVARVRVVAADPQGVLRHR